MSLSSYLPEGVPEKLGIFAISMLPDVGFWTSTFIFAPGSSHLFTNERNELGGKIQFDIMSMRNFGVGFASYLVWNECGGFEEAAVPLASYATLMILYWTYYPVLHVFKSNRLSLGHSIATSLSAATTSVLFWRVTQRAGVLMIPFLAHLGFTAIRQWANRDRRRTPYK